PLPRHSFPTRRSSDLPHNGRDGITETRVVLRYKAYPDCVGKSAEWLLDIHCLQPAYTGNRFQNPIDSGRQKTSRQRHAVHHDVRSEEHTSELQSRENL